MVTMKYQSYIFKFYDNFLSLHKTPKQKEEYLVVFRILKMCLLIVIRIRLICSLFIPINMLWLIWSFILFSVSYKQIQRKMSACAFARITKSSFSNVFLITAKRSFSKVFWIKALKVSKSTRENHAEELFQ